MRVSITNAAVCVAGLVGAIGSASGQSYTLFGPPAGWHTAFAVRGLSDDGQSAVGYSGFGGPEGYAPGYRWTRDGGRVDFSINGNPENSAAYGISGDGEWAVGSAYRGGDRAMEAYRYRPETGEFQFLGRLPGWRDSSAMDASRDGSVVVGEVHDRNGNFTRAFRWTESGGMQMLENARPSHFKSEAYAVSGDGALTVGTADDGTNGDAVVWTADGHGTLLPNLYTTPGASSVAYAISANGRFIAGSSSQELVIWEDGQIRSFGLFQNRGVTAMGVSNDGKAVIGDAGSYLPVIWTEARGLELVTTYLGSQGIFLPDGYFLSQVRGISSNGRTLVGSVYTPQQTFEGIVFTIPSPAAPAVIAIGLGVGMRRRRVP